MAKTVRLTSTLSVSDAYKALGVLICEFPHIDFTFAMKEGFTSRYAELRMELTPASREIQTKVRNRASRLVDGTR